MGDKIKIGDKFGVLEIISKDIRVYNKNMKMKYFKEHSRRYGGNNNE